MVVRIDPAFRRLIPKLSDDERAQLEANIVAAGGCRDPLVAWNGVLIDGHNRYEIATRLKLPYKVVSVSLPDRLAATIWIRWNQLGRRNLTDDQRANQVAGLVDDLAKQSKQQRASKAGKTGGRHHPKVSSVEAASTKLKSARIRTKLSKRARVSQWKVRQAQAIRKAAPELVERIDAGELTLADAVRATKRQEVLARLEDLATKEAKAIEGVYDVIVIDPPWPMKRIERDDRPQQVEFDYPRMTEEELRAQPIPCATDAHVWVWTTQRFLPMAFRLLDAWQLTYACTFVWHKAGGYQPLGQPQYNCEFVLYARRGSPAFIDTKAFPTCFTAERGEHSEKPSEFYELVRRVTAGRRLDMFNRRAIEGFDGWGKEAAA